MQTTSAARSRLDRIIYRIIFFLFFVVVAAVGAGCAGVGIIAANVLASLFGVFDLDPGVPL